MRSEKAIVTSRRESRSDALGIALVTASTWPIRADQARSMHGQSNSSTSNSGHTTQNISLKWDVFLAPRIPAITSDLAPGEKERPWPPISSTLISGERDAVLVDTPITVEQARALANWVAASGKNLTTIYTTHGHGDHKRVGNDEELLERFATFEGVEKRLDGNSRSPKHRRPAENIRVFHDDVVRGTHSCLQ
jgi:hypothetical protein